MVRYHSTRAAAAACIGLVLWCASCGRREPDYAAPESFIVDPATGIYYVSNVNTAKLKTKEDETPKREDNNGYITTLDKDLNIVKRRFVAGGRDDAELNDPKGMAIVGDTLWVADLRVVRAFDKTTGENTANVSLKKFDAVSLNDVAAGADGIIYVSDNLKNKVFQIDTTDRNKAGVFAEGAQLNGPNGLYWHPDEQRLYVACWNESTILTIDAEGQVETFMLDAGKFAHLDGIDRDAAGNFYVSDYHKGVIYRITPDRGVEAVVEKLKTPADISLDRANNRLLIPQMTADRITTFDLSGDD